jgi:hypothetical protein
VFLPLFWLGLVMRDRCFVSALDQYFMVTDFGKLRSYKYHGGVGNRAFVILARTDYTAKVLVVAVNSKTTPGYHIFP